MGENVSFMKFGLQNFFSPKNNITGIFLAVSIIVDSCLIY